MEQLRLIYIFTMVLRHGSMTAAATQLGMSASAVSQNIRMLERVYRIKLINRTTRSLSPTEEGRRLQEHGERLLEIEKQANRDMQKLQAEPEGEVRLTLPSGKAESVRIQNMILELKELYPGILLTLLENDEISDLAENNIDIALRFVEQPEGDNLVARFLVSWDTFIYASPEYLATNPVTFPRDLIRARWVNHNSQVLKSTFAALELERGLPVDRIDCPGRVSVAKELACAGLGLAVLFSEDASHYVQEGKLKIVLPHVSLAKRNVYVVTSNRVESARVNIVVTLLTKHFRKG